MLYKYLEKLIEDSKPNRIIDLDNSTFERTALFQICEANNILYTNVEFSRYDSHVIPTYTLGRKTDQYFRKCYQMVLAKIKNEERGTPLLDKFTNVQKIIAPDYNLNNTSKRYIKPLKKDIRRFLSTLKFLISETFKNRKYANFFSRKPLISSYFDAILINFLFIYRERKVLSEKSKIFQKPDSKDKYVYFPLHYIPESSTLIKAPFYPNETPVIEAISKSLPVNWCLYVKEHGAMIGERPISFYKHLKRFSNVKLVDIGYYDDPKPWIQNCVGVVTLTGTSAFEAAMFGKRSIIFGNASFDIIKTIHRVTSFEELPSALKKFKIPLESDYKYDAEAYLKTVMKVGKRIPFNKMIIQSISKSKEHEDDQAYLDSIIKDLTELLLLDYQHRSLV